MMSMIAGAAKADSCLFFISAAIYFSVIVVIYIEPLVYNFIHLFQITVRHVK